MNLALLARVFGKKMLTAEWKAQIIMNKLFTGEHVNVTGETDRKDS